MGLALLVLFTVVLFLVLYFGKQLVDHFILIYYVHKLPGPPKGRFFLLGNVATLMVPQEKLLQIAMDWTLKYYPIFKVWIGSLAAVCIFHPEDAALVMSDMKHMRKSIVYNILKRWLQTGLLMSNDEKWIHRRKILTPSFHFTILQDFLQVFNERTADFVEKLKMETNKPYTEINDMITNFTLRVITETAMGRKMKFHSYKEKTYEKSLHNLGTIMVHRLFRGILLYEWIYIFTCNFFREMKLVKILHNFTKEVISEREKHFQTQNGDTKKKRLAMLDLLLKKKSEGEIDDSGIREEVDTFMFEGHDTVSTAINFGLMLIACHPQIQKEIVQEMEEVLGDITKKPSYEELQELRCMERCIKEVMRLYPSVPLISRQLGEDIVTTSGYKLKKNTVVGIVICGIHHSPELYPDPEKFDPDRFLPENCKDRHPFAYLPFSAGPRNCIGQKFAMLEMKTLFCGILGNFVLEPVDTPQTIVVVGDVVLRTKNNIKVKFVPRK